MPTMPLTVFQHAATALSRRMLSRLDLYQHCLLACTRKTLVISRFLRCLKCQDTSTPVLLITVWTYLHHVNHVSWVHLRKMHKMILKWCLSLTKQEVSSGSNRWKPSSVATLSSTWTAGNSPTHPDNWTVLSVFLWDEAQLAVRLTSFWSTVWCVHTASPDYHQPSPQYRIRNRRYRRLIIQGQYEHRPTIWSWGRPARLSIMIPLDQQGLSWKPQEVPMLSPREIIRCRVLYNCSEVKNLPIPCLAQLDFRFFHSPALDQVPSCIRKTQSLMCASHTLTHVSGWPGNQT